MQAHRERPLHVHCVVNMRVSAFTFLYRIRHEGADPAAAKADVERIWTPNPIWQEFLDDHLADLDLEYAAI